MGKNLLIKIKVTPQKIIKLSFGNIMRFLKKGELKNWSFGEAYFSKIKFGKIKIIVFLGTYFPVTSAVARSGCAQHIF